MQYLEMRKGRVEIIPMIDIMLFLLVFFVMVTIHMIPAQGIPSHLPGSTTAQTLPPPKLMLTLHGDGSLELDGQPLTLAQLTARLRGRSAKTQITIASDKGADVQQLVKVMDACRKAGITAVGLAAKRH
ncbi:MAG: biopolymer transporter ExbD [Betaproteobacteria bacterium]|nr:biopolymer transporter ExbD [Betaproteobacteria bacterium]